MLASNLLDPVEHTPEGNHFSISAVMISFRAIEQFYYREARLLDERQFKAWLELCSEEIEYVIPNRSAPEPVRAEEGSETYHSVTRELSGASPDESPLRVENYFTLALRLDRLLKHDSWAENPPARTRRMVGNIELLDTQKGPTQNQLLLHTVSNIFLYYSRRQEQFLYTGQRRDVLQATDNKDEPHVFRISKREIILDWSVITSPTVGLIF